MMGIRLLILIGQIGSLWSKHRKEIKIFKTLAIGGFFALYLRKNFNKDEDNEYNNFKGQIK